MDRRLDKNASQVCSYGHPNSTTNDFTFVLIDSRVPTGLLDFMQVASGIKLPFFHFTDGALLCSRRVLPFILWPR